VQKAVKDLMTALDDEEAEIVKQQHAAAQPGRHQFSDPKVRRTSLRSPAYGIA
jgi:hypothetical protein